MNRTIFRTSLDIHDIYSQATFAIKQGDTSGRLMITLTEGGKPYHITESCYAVFSAVKDKSGTLLHNDCFIQNNTIIYDFTKGTTSTAERLNCEIMLYSEDGDTLLSPRFTVVVHESAQTEEVLENTNEYNSLSKLISAANNLVQEVSRKLENGEFIGEKGEQGIQGEKGEKGADGKDYILTATDKAEIANLASENLPSEEWIFTDENDSVITKNVYANTTSVNLNGTWVLKSSIVTTGLPSNSNISFTSNGASFNSISYSILDKTLFYNLTPVYSSNKWDNEAYRNIVFDNALCTTKFYSWLKNNAVKQ